jgi:hypothetical protein
MTDEIKKVGYSTFMNDEIKKVEAELMKRNLENNQSRAQKSIN